MKISLGTVAEVVFDQPVGLPDLGPGISRRCFSGHAVHQVHLLQAENHADQWVPRKAA